MSTRIIFQIPVNLLSEKKPLFCTVICVPYDNEAAADIARRDPGLPRKEAYIREVLTGIYSR